MPCGLYSTISGILAAAILGFGTADLLLVLHLHRDLAPWSGWLLLCFLQDLIHSLNSLAQSCPSCSRARPARRGILVSACFVCFFCFVLA